MKDVSTVCQVCGATKQPMIVWGKYRLGCVSCRAAKVEAKKQAKTEANNNRRVEPRRPGTFQVSFVSRLDGDRHEFHFAHKEKGK